MRVLMLSALLALATMLQSGRAAAQELEPPRHRQGYYAAYGINAIVTTARENGVTLGPWLGNGSALRFGQAVTRHLTLGLAIEAGISKKGRQEAVVNALGLESSWALTDNLAVRAGVGLGVMNLKDHNDLFESSTRGATGAWFSTGLSYDWFPNKWRASGGWAITPTALVRYLPGDETWGFVSFIGFEVTYWTGLPNEQLDLPPSEAFKK